MRISLANILPHLEALLRDVCQRKIIYRIYYRPLIRDEQSHRFILIAHYNSESSSFAQRLLLVVAAFLHG